MLKMRLKWQLCKSSKWKPLAWSIWGPTIRSCCQLPRHPSVALSYLKRLYQMHLRRGGDQNPSKSSSFWAQKTQCSNLLVSNDLFWKKNLACAPFTHFAINTVLPWLSFYWKKIFHNRNTSVGVHTKIHTYYILLCL